MKKTPIFLIIITLAVNGCKQKGESTEKEADTAVTATRILIPNPNERLHYETTIRLYPPAQKGDIPEETDTNVVTHEDGSIEITYVETQTYVGEREILPEVLAQVYETQIGGEPVSRQFVKIDDGKLYSLASQKLYPEKKEPNIHFAPILVMDESLEDGQNWLIERALGKDQYVPLRISYIINRGEVATKAGTYHCIHVNSKGYSAPHTSTSDVWFAPRVGVIQEKTRRFDTEKIVSEETRVLIRHDKGEQN